MKQTNLQIDYIEFKSNDLHKTKAFYIEVFGWKFTDYGDGYAAFTDGSLDGGFELSDQPITNGALIVLYHKDLPAIKDAVIKAGGTISVDIFSFPGGQRFQFLDPSGNELAIWSE